MHREFVDSRESFLGCPSPEDWADYEAWQDWVEIEEANLELAVIANELQDEC